MVTNPNMTQTTEDGLDIEDLALENRLQQLAAQSEAVSHMDKLKKKASGKSRVVQLNLISEDTFQNQVDQGGEETVTAQERKRREYLFIESIRQGKE